VERRTISVMSVRTPAVAGAFYPADPGALRAAIGRYLRAAKPAGPLPKAIIAPHAGYVYSGPVAASAYACVMKGRSTVTRVVLLGPAHYVLFRGLAASGAKTFATPLGAVHVDANWLARALELPQVRVFDEAHAEEHSLEVHLPFLQEVLERFAVVPFVVGEAEPAAVAEVLERLWDGGETLIVVSSDLSHYHDYETARRLDLATSRAIEALEPEGVLPEHACGRNPVNGLLLAARRKGLLAKTVDLRNSGDTAGPREEVVGYGAYLFYEST
jgi:hypothetical protein